MSVAADRAVGSRGRLNTFQRAMLQWSDLHPHNGIHIYQLAGPLRLESLREAVEQTYRQCGLGAVAVDRRGSYRYQAGGAPEIRVHAEAEEPQASISTHAAEELNRCFNRPCCQRLRLCVLPAGKTHYLSVTYDHWIGDCAGVLLIMWRILGRYCSLDIPENFGPLDLYPATYRNVFGHRLHGAHLGVAAMKTTCQWLRNRSTSRVPYSAAGQMSVGFEMHRTSPEAVPRLTEFARSVGATVHDVMLAALGRAMSEFLPKRATRRRELVLGTVVNTRGDACEDLSQTLGTFLAYYLVRMACGEQASLADATLRIAEITRPIKAKKSYLDSLLGIKAMTKVWPYLSASARPRFMRKALPTVAGISNVFLRGTWLDRCAGGQILELSRATSTGPSFPLMLCPTTVGDKMNVGVTYRLTAFSRDRIDGITGRFLEQIEEPGRAE